MIFFAAGYHSDYYEICVKHDVLKLWSIIYELKHINAYEPETADWIMVDSGAHSWNRVTSPSTPPAANLPPVNEHIKWYIDYILNDDRKNIMYVEFDCFKFFTIEELDSVFSKLPQEKVFRVYHPSFDGGTIQTVKDWVNKVLNISGSVMTALIYLMQYSVLPGTKLRSTVSQ